MKKFVLLLMSLFVSVNLYAVVCQGVSGEACNGHKHLLGSNYSYTEDFNDGDVQASYGAGWVTVVQGCPERDYVNFTNSSSANTVMRGFLKIVSATAPVGSRVAVRFTVDGTAHGQYIRTLTGNYPQGEDFGSVFPDTPEGSHQMKLEVWLVDGPGSITINLAFLTAQSAPTGFGAGSVADGNSMTVDGTWRQVTPTLTINSSTNVNLLTQAYFQVDDGVPGDKLSVGFSLDGASSQHTIELAVPQRFPSGFNIMDQYKYKPGYIVVPAGSHTISLWARNLSGNTTTIQNREVEAIGFEANDDSETLMLEAIETEPMTVTPTGNATVFEDLLEGCGAWTKILQYNFTLDLGQYCSASNPDCPYCDPGPDAENLLPCPLYPAMIQEGEQQNMVGEGYVEFNNTSGSPIMVDVAIEALFDPTLDSNNDPISAVDDADFSLVTFTIPPGRHQKFFFTHPLIWGTHKPNLFRLLVRGRDGCASATDNFDVVKRYMAIKAIPITGATDCQYD